MPVEIPSLPMLDKEPETLVTILNEFFQNLIVTVNELVPTGTIFPFAGGVIPEGWLVCNGATYDIEDYKALAKAIGIAWGGGATTFQVPDFRDKVLFGQNGTTRLITSNYGNIDTATGTVSGKGVNYIIKV